MSDSLDKVLDATKQTHDAVGGFLDSVNCPGFIRDIVAGGAAGIVMVATFLPLALITGAIDVGSFVAVQLLDAIGNAREQNADDFNKVIAASLSEFLGVDISPGELPSGGGAGAAQQAWGPLGDKLYSVLTQQIVPDGTVSPEQGEQAAHRFTGFAINFAVTSAFLAILAEGISIGFLKEFAELGRETGQALGMGRLQRLALGTLLQELVQKPYQDSLRKQYRPNRLADVEVVHAFQRGFFDSSTMQNEMAIKGYSDEAIASLVEEHTPHLANTDIERLLRFQRIDQTEALADMKNSAFPDRTAGQLIDAANLVKAETIVQQIVGDLHTKVLDGFLSADEFSSALSDLPLSDEEQKWHAARLALQMQYPRAKLTLAQLQTAFIEGIVDASYVDDWITAAGYDPEAQLVIWFETLIKLDKELTKEKAQQQKQALQAQKSAKKRAPLA